MARSFRELIEYVLGEISLCGSQGASFVDVLAFIDDFYSTPIKPSPFQQGTGRVPNIGHRFKSRVWTWLTRHPELSVGKDREGNSLTFDQIETRCCTPIAQVDGIASDGNPLKAIAPESEATSSEVPVGHNQEELRIFVSEERTWLAIVGHLPDISRVSPFEFALLSIIASRKGKGIVQSELSAISGQDKRSVPKRTDVLQERGYIEKKPVQYKSTRTSLCILRKFTGNAIERKDHSDDTRSVIDMEVFFEDIFACLRQYRLISRNDLRAQLTTKARYRLRILARAIRRLESMGCIRRVKAFSQYSRMKNRVLSIELIREPTELDRRKFLANSVALTSASRRDDVDEIEAEEDERDEVDETDPQSKQLVKVAQRPIPQWVPGVIPLPNLLFKLIDASGTKGLTNRDLVIVALGKFFRKPVELVLGRLIETWQVSQPLHLRHMALVRDSELRGTINCYVHYSFRNFGALVEQGHAMWEAVEVRDRRGKKGFPPDATAQLDDYGFPVNYAPPGQLDGGNATLQECLAAANPKDYFVSKLDPVATQLPDGTWTVQHSRVGWAKRALRRMFALDGSPASNEAGSASLIKRKRDIDMWLGTAPGGSESDGPEPKRQKKEKKKKQNDEFEGMTEKERLEAQGLDESYTEYSVLCLERPEPGLYMTSFGKRRPIGKARGRPPKSRIAIFKFPWLKDLEWLTTQPKVTFGPEPTPLSSLEESSKDEVSAVRNAIPSALPAVPVQCKDNEEPTMTMQPTISQSPLKRIGRPPKKRPTTETEKPPPKKRGRPPKHTKITHGEVDQGVAEVPSTDTVVEPIVAEFAKQGLVALADPLRPASPIEVDEVPRVFAPSGSFGQIHETEAKPPIVVQPEKPPPKKRGRPPKKRPNAEDQATVGGEKPPPKKRGRPPKRQRLADGQAAEISAEGQERAMPAEAPPTEILPAQVLSADIPTPPAPTEEILSENIGGESMAVESVEEVPEIAEAPIIAPDAMLIDEPERNQASTQIAEIPHEAISRERVVQADNGPKVHFTPPDTMDIDEPGRTADKAVEESIKSHIPAPEPIEAVGVHRPTPQATEVSTQVSPTAPSTTTIGGMTVPQQVKSPTAPREPMSAFPDIPRLNKDAQGKPDRNEQSAASTEFTALPPGTPGIDREAQIDSVEQATTGTHGVALTEATSPSKSRRSTTRETITSRRDASQASKVAKPKSTEDSLTVKGRGSRKVNTRESGGSVALLRRKIIMDTLKDCRGVHPMGSALWYPFTTAWFKTKYKEKPDLKTIRTTVGSLIEAGKLRQHTFTGKNKKGLMVTKSLIADVELDPEDPIILNLQEKMLEADPQHYFPPGSDIDQSLKKTSRKSPLVPKVIPELDDVKVQLHKPPVSLMNRERTGLRGPRRIYHPGERRHRGPEIRRLKALLKRANPNLSLTGVPVSSYANATVSICPDQKAEIPKSLMVIPSGLNMLTNQSQTFHDATGTFATIPYVSMEPWALPWAKDFDMHLPISLEPPECLEDILDQTEPPDSGYLIRVFDETTEQFFSEIKMVYRWEMMNQGAFEPLPPNQYTYINHVAPESFHAVPMEDAPQFADDVLPAPEPQREPPLTRRRYDTLAPGYDDETAYPVQHVWQLPSKKGVKPFSWTIREPIPITAHVEPTTTTTRRLERLQEHADGRPSIPTVAEERASGLRRQRVSSKLFPPAVTQKIIVTILVVRALAGGQEGKHIDWQIVLRLFPDYPPKLVHHRGKSLVSRHRLQMSKMQSDFQGFFTAAYENDEVPRIDYNDLLGYDWAWVVDWAEEKLGAPPKPTQTPVLPATRAQFDSLFDIRKESTESLNEIYQQSSNVTIPRKQALFSSTIFASKLRGPAQSEEEATSTQAEEMEKLNIAKSWVRSNVVTPDELYDPLQARQTLEGFGEDLITRSIRALITERVIYHRNKGRIAPGRNYDISEQFLMNMGKKRSLEITQLRQAAHFKKHILDERFRFGEKLAVNEAADDGDILALINLAEMGMVKVLPRDPPKDKWGLTDTGYLTRMMDKGKLRFTIDVFPVVDKYVYGEPLAQAVQSTPIPKNSLEDETIDPTTVKIPLWIDVHRKFIKVLWDSAVAIVLGAVSLRPGIGAREMATLLAPALGAWEIELIAKWLEDVSAVQRTSGSGSEAGWAVKDWWWTVIV